MAAGLPGFAEAGFVWFPAKRETAEQVVVDFVRAELLHVEVVPAVAGQYFELEPAKFGSELPAVEVVASVEVERTVAAFAHSAVAQPGSA